MSDQSWSYSILSIGLVVARVFLIVGCFAKTLVRHAQRVAAPLLANGLNIPTNKVNSDTGIYYPSKATQPTNDYAY